jgi:hypothetical protein
MEAEMFIRVKEKLRSGEMSVPGDQWPIFVYQGYNYDPEDPWNGLFRSSLLVCVRKLYLCPGSALRIFPGIQTHFYFTQLRRKGAQGYTIR